MAWIWEHSAQEGYVDLTHAPSGNRPLPRPFERSCYEWLEAEIDGVTATGAPFEKAPIAPGIFPPEDQVRLLARRQALVVDFSARHLNVLAAATAMDFVRNFGRAKSRTSRDGRRPPLLL